MNITRLEVDKGNRKLTNIKLFPWGGTFRLPSTIQLGIYTMTPWEFLTTCTEHEVDPSPVLDQLQAIAQAPNVEFTPGALKYHMNTTILTSIVNDMDKGKSAMPIKIIDPNILNKVDGYGFTHSHDLRHGRVCMVDLLGSVKSNPWKMGKRLKLFTGFRVSGEHPLPSSIMECEDKCDFGVIYVSRGYAGRYRLDTNTGFTSILENGDKLAGCLPNGWVIKGSVVVRDQKPDMVVPQDALKVRGAKFEINTRMWVRSRAAERIGSRPTKLSYQIGQFYPEIVRDMILDRLSKPWKDGSEYTYYDMIAGRASKNDYIDLLTWELENGELDRHPAAEIIEGNASRYENGWREFKLKPAIAGLSNEHTGDIHHPLSKSVIHTVLRRRMDDLINAPVRGVWGVLMPYNGERDTVSIPKNLFYYLGCPKYVAAIRYPVKGKTSLVRLRCTYHYDGSDIRVHNDIVDVVQSGDFDGDQGLITSTRVFVDAAMDPNVAYEICKHGKEHVASKLSVVSDRIKSLLPLDIDKSIAQCSVAKWRGTIALATTIRDNLHVLLRDSKYNYSESEVTDMLIRFMEGVMQPSLAQMDGDVPLAHVLVGDPSEPRSSSMRKGRADIISKLTGIPQEVLVNEDGEVHKWALPSLNELRCSINGAYRATLYTLKSIAQDDVGTSPHMMILSAFKDIEPY